MVDKRWGSIFHVDISGSAHPCLHQGGHLYCVISVYLYCVNSVYSVYCLQGPLSQGLHLVRGSVSSLSTTGGKCQGAKREHLSLSLRWFVLLIPVFGRQKQDNTEFKASTWLHSESENNTLATWHPSSHTQKSFVSDDKAPILVLGIWTALPQLLLPTLSQP